MYLPKKNLNKLIVGFLVFAFYTLFSQISISNAASAYINPSQGRITAKTFLVSVYVESSTSEPEMASSKIKITYPASVNVISVNNGDFDTYLEKNFDATTRVITINAVNNAGNYKSGKVKLASINFETVEIAGQAQLTIDPQSEISGSGGEALLTETINSTYTLSVQETTTDTTQTDTTTDTTVTTTTSNVPSTGVSDIAFYALVASILMASGAFFAIKKA